MESLAPSPPGVFRLRPEAALEPAAFPLGLGARGVHEVCEAAFGDMAALTGFALAAGALRPGAIAWVMQTRRSLDHGRPFMSGLGAIRQAPPPVLQVEAPKLTDALWAVEEAVCSATVALVVAELEAVDFTASRRLALASGRHGVPVILLLPYTSEGATAAAARWRVSARPSAPNRFDPRAPGFARWRALLERSRLAPHMAGQSFDVELNDETLSLRVVSGLAADAPRARPPASRAATAIRRRA